MANIKEISYSPEFESILPLIDAAGDKWVAVTEGKNLPEAEAEAAREAFASAMTAIANSIHITDDDFDRCLSYRLAYNKDGSPKTIIGRRPRV